MLYNRVAWILKHWCLEWGRFNCINTQIHTYRQTTTEMCHFASSNVYVGQTATSIPTSLMQSYGEIFFLFTFSLRQSIIWIALRDSLKVDRTPSQDVRVPLKSSPIFTMDSVHHYFMGTTRVRKRRGPQSLALPSATTYRIWASVKHQEPSDVKTRTSETQ